MPRDRQSVHPGHTILILITNIGPFDRREVPGATNIIMPSLGFDMSEGKVAAWLKVEGARVEKGEPVVEIETEKATVEVEASAAGVLARIVVVPGGTVPVGTVIGIIAAVGEALPEIAAATADTEKKQ